MYSCIITNPRGVIRKIELTRMILLQIAEVASRARSNRWTDFANRNDTHSCAASGSTIPLHATPILPAIGEKRNSHLVEVIQKKEGETDRGDGRKASSLRRGNRERSRRSKRARMERRRYAGSYLSHLSVYLGFCFDCSRWTPEGRRRLKRPVRPTEERREEDGTNAPAIVFGNRAGPKSW